MSDLEKVINGLTQHLSGKVPRCDNCMYSGAEDMKKYTDPYSCALSVMADALQLLKEQKPVEPVRDPKCGRVWLCGNCGQFVGFEDNDPSDPNEYDHFCRSCGKAVKWDA